MQHEQVPHALREGDLYVVRDGELRLIEPDPNDTSVRIRLTRDAYWALKGARDTITRARRYRPELNDVASALIRMHSDAPDLLDVMLRYRLLQLAQCQVAGR